MDAATPKPQETAQDWIRRLGEAVGGSAQASVSSYLMRQRWFGAKGRRAVGVGMHGEVVLEVHPRLVLLALIEVRYAEGPPEVYSLPLVIQLEQEVRGETAENPALLLVLKGTGESALVLDGTREPSAMRILLDGLRDQRRWSGPGGVVRCAKTRAGAPLLAQPVEQAKVLAAEQSNTSIVFDRRLILKLIRKLEPGVNPDAEVLEFLTERTSYRHIPVLAGVIRYEREAAAGGQTSAGYTLAVLQPFVPNQGDGWSATLAQLAEFLRRASATGLNAGDLSAQVEHLASALLGDLDRLGLITAGLHCALASDATTAEFRPEAITAADCGEWRHEMEAQVRTAFAGLRGLGQETRTSLGLQPRAVDDLERACLQRLEDLIALAERGVAKIRHHGDYHLGQVLKAGADFVILDFEGEPARPLAARRAKVCALRDVAGMVRSFDYAAEAAIRQAGETTTRERDLLEAWRRAAARAFLDGYFRAAVPGEVVFLPPTRDEAERILKTYELDKAIYELRYEVNNRPDWIGIPLEGIRRLVS